MKTILTIIIILIALLIAAETKITFKPFSIQFGNLIGLVGIIFLALGFICMSYKSEKNAERRGYEKGVEDTSREIERLYKDKMGVDLKINIKKINYKDEKSK